MLFLMVETFSKDGIKIGLFPTEFIKKSFFEKCSKMGGTSFPEGGQGARGGGVPIPGSRRLSVVPGVRCGHGAS